MKLRVLILLIATLGATFVARAASPAPMHEVIEIARAVSVVQPNLSDAKYIEYAMGIYRAAKRFDVEPMVLIAITHQESGFREHLPEGPAGETGICQILKSWLENEKFRAEFGTLKTSDMKKPSKSFLFAAWILRDLKSQIESGTLPYWSFYNSKKFQNRFRYFLRVNRNLSAIRKHAPKVYEEAALHGPADQRLALARKPASEPRRRRRLVLKGLLGATTKAAALADLNF